MTKLDEAINEIKELAKSFKERNGNSSLRIPNKDLNLWMVYWMIKQDGRIGKIETKNKMLMWFFSVSIALIALFRII